MSNDHWSSPEQMGNSRHRMFDDDGTAPSPWPSEPSQAAVPFADGPPSYARPYPVNPVSNGQQGVIGYGVAMPAPGAAIVPQSLIDPVTGEHLSTKSKVLAGLLQCFVGWFGTGRFYIGDVRRGGAQLAMFFLGYFVIALGVNFPVWLLLSAWCLGDAVYMWSGRARDQFGRRLN